MELVGKVLSDKRYQADLPSSLMMGSVWAACLIIPAKELITAEGRARYCGAGQNGKAGTFRPARPS
jgi:hypothetical protein